MDVTLQGNPANSYFKLGPIQARRLGLEPHPDFPHALVLAEDADPTARLTLPNGQVFTAEELTTLADKSGNPQHGWQVWSNDPGGYPSWGLSAPEPSA